MEWLRLVRLQDNSVDVFLDSRDLNRIRMKYVMTKFSVNKCQTVVSICIIMQFLYNITPNVRERELLLQEKTPDRSSNSVQSVM